MKRTGIVLAGAATLVLALPAAASAAANPQRTLYRVTVASAFWSDAPSGDVAPGTTWTETTVRFVRMVGTLRGVTTYRYDTAQYDQRVLTTDGMLSMTWGYAFADQLPVTRTRNGLSFSLSMPLQRCDEQWQCTDLGSPTVTAVWRLTGHKSASTTRWTDHVKGAPTLVDHELWLTQAATATVTPASPGSLVEASLRSGTTKFYLPPDV